MGWDPLRLARTPGLLWRYREAEVMHARFGMLGAAMLFAPEALGVDDVATLTPPGAAALLFLAYSELLRLRHERRTAAARSASGEAAWQRRIYPGSRFDALGVMSDSIEGPGLGVYSTWLGLGALDWLAGGWWFSRHSVGGDADAAHSLKTSELQFGRVAM